MTIFHKLVLSSVALSLLVAVIGEFAAFHSHRALRESVRRASEVIAVETMDKIDRAIQRRLDDLRMYAGRQRLQEALAESNNRFDRMADPLGHVRRLDARWTSAPKHVQEPWMHALPDRGLSDALQDELQMDDFYRAAYGYALYGEVFVTNKYGANVAQTGWTSDYNQADEAWWQDAREHGVHVGDITYDESAGTHALDLAVAVHDSQNAFAGTIKAVLDMRDIVGIMDRVKSASEYRSVTLDLLSGASDILYHVGPLHLADDSSWALEPFEGPERLRPSHHRIIRTPDGITAFVACARSQGDRDFEGLPWTLVAGCDADEVLAPAARLRKTLLAFSVLMAGATLLGGLLLARHIGAPIVRLTEVAHIISERRDYSVRAPQVFHGEMRTLVETFNSLLGQMQQHEHTLMAANEKLGTEVAERRRAEQEQALLLHRLGETNRELQHFAYVVSHDLKAPLRGIKMLAEWLSADCADQLGDEAKENLDLLQNRVDRMHNLIEGILQYCRVGRITEDMVPVDLNALLPEIIDAIAPPEHIAIRLDGRLPVIDCEKTRITQVFQNLLSNAVKFMDKPRGEVVVACSEDADAWTFSVSDNGPGIEEKHFDRIFKIFQTLASRDEYESTGVGLALVKKIVEQYGGRVWLASEVGKGSTFFFTFPTDKQRTHREKLQTSAVG